MVVAKRRRVKFLSWTSFTGGNSTNPFERFQGLARPSTKSNRQSAATELSRGAEASQVYDRDFFFGFIARHPSLGQWTGAIAPREGSLSKENEKILFPRLYSRSNAREGSR